MCTVYKGERVYLAASIQPQGFPDGVIRIFVS
jgi:hypothetical protein